MTNILPEMARKNLIHPPRWLPDETQYLTYMGSQAYGVDGVKSDLDVYGWAIPPKDMVFPHLRGEVLGFGQQIQRFEQWSEHHIKRHDGSDVEYDFTIFSVVKQFQLCMENNPNMIDSLFTPRRCILHSTPVGEHVRENRKLFLHKGSWHKFKGYAYSQMQKIGARVNHSNPDRAESIEKHGYDVKFAYHVVRLLSEVEMIMIEHDLDLERNREQLKAIRRGEWTLEYLQQWALDKEKHLEGVYLASTLPHGPDEPAIKRLLLEVLEMHYGSLSGLIRVDASAEALIRDLKDLISRYPEPRPLVGQRFKDKITNWWTTGKSSGSSSLIGT